MGQRRLKPTKGLYPLSRPKVAIKFVGPISPEDGQKWGPQLNSSRAFWTTQPARFVLSFLIFFLFEPFQLEQSFIIMLRNQCQKIRMGFDRIFYRFLDFLYMRYTVDYRRQSTVNSIFATRVFVSSFYQHSPLYSPLFPPLFSKELWYCLGSKD